MAYSRQKLWRMEFGHRKMFLRQRKGAGRKYVQALVPSVEDPVEASNIVTTDTDKNLAEQDLLLMPSTSQSVCMATKIPSPTVQRKLRDLCSSINFVHQTRSPLTDSNITRQTVSSISSSTTGTSDAQPRRAFYPKRPLSRRSRGQDDHQEAGGKTPRIPLEPISSNEISQSSTKLSEWLQNDVYPPDYDLSSGVMGDSSRNDHMAKLGKLEPMEKPTELFIQTAKVKEKFRAVGDNKMPCGCIPRVQTCSNPLCRSNLKPVIVQSETDGCPATPPSCQGPMPCGCLPGHGMSCGNIKCKGNPQVNRNVPCKCCSTGYCLKEDCIHYRPAAYNDESSHDLIQDAALLNDYAAIRTQTECTCKPCMNVLCQCRTQKMIAIAEPYLKFVPSLEKPDFPIIGKAKGLYDALTEEEKFGYDPVIYEDKWTGYLVKKSHIVQAFASVFLYIVIVIFALMGAISMHPLAEFYMGNDLNHMFTDTKFIHITTDAYKGEIAVTYPQATTFYDISTVPEFWEYTEQIVSRLLFSSMMWTSEHVKRHERYVGAENRVMGLIRFRQKRVSSQSCETHFAVSGKFFRCYAGYQPHLEEKKEVNMFPGGEYQDGVGYPYMGKVASYDPGGFVVDVEPKDLVKRLKEMKTHNWIDRSTRVVFVTMFLVNANIHRQAMVQLTFEKPPHGGIVPTLSLHVDNLFRYKSPEFIFNALVDGICLFLIMLKQFFSVRSLIIRLKRKEPPPFWNIYTVIVLFYGIAFLITQFIMYSHFGDMAANSHDDMGYIEIEKMSSQCDRLKDFRALLVLLLWMRLIKYVIFNKTMRIVEKVASAVYCRIFLFSFVFIIVLVAFAQLGKLLFGNQSYGFYSFHNAFKSVLNALIGNFNYKEILSANPTMAPIYYVLFLLVVVFIVLNMFVAIITEAYRQNRRLITYPPIPNLWMYLNKRYFLHWFSCYGKNSSRMTWVKALQTHYFTDREIAKIVRIYHVQPTGQVNEKQLKTVLKDICIVHPRVRLRRARTLKEEVMDLQKQVIDTEHTVELMSRKVDDMLHEAIISVDQWTEMRKSACDKTGGWRALFRRRNAECRECCFTVRCVAPEAACACGAPRGCKAKECHARMVCHDLPCSGGNSDVCMRQ